MSEGYLMDLEKLSKIYADSFRRLSEANRRPTVREAIDNFRANTAVMRNEIGNNTKEDGNMVTVKQVRDLGIELVADDIVSVDDECKSQVTFEPIGHRYIDGVNNLRFGWEYSVVKEFAPRKNEGVQPVADDVLVDAVYRDGSSENCVRARDRYWPIDNDSSDIVTWKPSFKNWENEMNDNQEIKIGLTCADDEQEKVEWKNGDECTYMGAWAIVIGWHPQQTLIVIDTNDGFEAVRPDELSKPETPEQREERETISELCKLVENDEYTNSLNVNLDCSVAMRAVIDLIAKEGYRLEVKPTKESE